MFSFFFFFLQLPVYPSEGFVQYCNQWKLMECHCFSLHSNNPSTKHKTAWLCLVCLFDHFVKSLIYSFGLLLVQTAYLVLLLTFHFSSSIVHHIPPLLSSPLLVTSRPIDLPVFLLIFHFSISSSLVFLLSSGCCCIFIPLLFCLSSPAACDRQLCRPTNLYRQM